MSIEKRTEPLIIASKLPPEYLVGEVLEEVASGTRMGKVTKNHPGLAMVELEGGGYLHYEDLSLCKVVNEEEK